MVYTIEELMDSRNELERRVREIISEVNETNLGASSSRYLSGGSGVFAKGKKNKGTQEEMEKSELKSRQSITEIYRKQAEKEEEEHGDSWVATLPMDSKGSKNIRGGGNRLVHRTDSFRPSIEDYKPKRKRRADAGTKRGPSEWIQLVKLVQEKEGISYKEAMKVASEVKRRDLTIDDVRRWKKVDSD